MGLRGGPYNFLHDTKEREREREREREFICQVSKYNVHEITYNGRLPESHMTINAGHL